MEYRLVVMSMDKYFKDPEFDHGTNATTLPSF